MKLKDNSTKEIDTALYQLEQKLNSKISNIKFPEQEVYDDKDIRTALEEEITNRKTAIKSEADTRKSTDDTLQQLIGTETEARETADKTISDNLADEITNRTDADKTLQDNIDKKQNTLTAGDNITITNDTISATDTTYTATSPITLSGTDIQLDTVPVEKGGTGKTTARTAFMNLAEGLSENSGPLDTECIIYRNTDGSNWGRYTLSTFWSWIKGKIENVFDTLIAHPSDTDNPHSVTKDQVGLGNCDNTADSDKNVNSALYISRTNSTAPSSNTLIKFAGSTDGYTMSAELTNGDDLEIRNKLIDDVTTKETWYGNTTKLMTLQPTGSGTSITGADLTLHNGTITATKFSGSLSGNASSATKLATARSISITDGTNTGTASSFDGSGDISLSLPSTIKATSFIQNGKQVLSTGGYKGYVYICGSKASTNPYIKLATMSFTSALNMDYFTKFRFSMLGCGQYAWCDFVVNARIIQGVTLTVAPNIKFLNSSGNTAINYFYNHLYLTYTLSDKTLTMTLWVNGANLQYSSWFCYYLQEFESTFADFCMYMQSYGNLWTKTTKTISNATGDASSLPDTVGNKSYWDTYLDNISCQRLVIPTTSSTTNGAIWLG